MPIQYKYSHHVQMLDTSRTQTEAGPKTSLSLSSLLALAVTLLWSKYQTCNQLRRHAVSIKLYYATIYWYVYRHFGLVQPFFAELAIRDAHRWGAHWCCNTIRNSHPKIQHKADSTKQIATAIKGRGHINDSNFFGIEEGQSCPNPALSLWSHG